MTNEKNRPTGKRVLLFSGGLDSLCAAWLLKPDVLLFLKHGQRYESAESAAITWLQRRGQLPPQSQVVESTALQLGQFERPDAIIPMRNLLFVTVASLYGETVYLSAVDGDRSLDKSKPFFIHSSDLLTYLYGPQHWCEPRNIQVAAPFHHMTKTDMVRHYLQAGAPAAALLTGLSCYDMDKHEARSARPCGICKACFRKWVALQNNGVEIPAGYFAAAPWTAPWLAEALPAVREGSYRGREDGDWVRALDAVGV